jgi:hypothetical protein
MILNKVFHGEWHGPLRDRSKLAETLLDEDWRNRLFEHWEPIFTPFMSVHGGDTRNLFRTPPVNSDAGKKQQRPVTTPQICKFPPIAFEESRIFC